MFDVTGRRRPKAGANLQARFAGGPVDGGGWAAPKEAGGLQVFGGKTSVLGNTSQHTGADLFAVVKREDYVGPLFAGKSTVRTWVPLDLPPNAKQCSEQPLGIDGWPLTYAAIGREMVISTGRDSRC